MNEKHIIEVPYEIVERSDLTPEEIKDLLMATQARGEAYAPYSNFTVGTTLRTNDDKTVIGWNVENVAYEVLHAEVDALGNIRKESRETGLKRITLMGGPEDSVDSENIVTPCGGCRQKLLEFFRKGDETIVLAAGIRGKVMRIKLPDLLPHAFFPACLQEDPEVK